MNRRAFLHTLSTGLAATAALAAVDPERLLWTPGAKTFFLPAEKKVEEVVFGTHGLQRGDVITINGIYAINPVTRKETPFLQRFVVTADAEVGQVNVPIRALWPTILPRGNPDTLPRRIPRAMRANRLFVGHTIADAKIITELKA